MSATCQKETIVLTVSKSASAHALRLGLTQLSLTSIFPMFSPLKSPRKAFGACSTPWKTVWRHLILPAACQAAKSFAKAGCRSSDSKRQSPEGASFWSQPVPNCADRSAVKPRYTLKSCHIMQTGQMSLR